jgi:hypothetical protein
MRRTDAISQQSKPEGATVLPDKPSLEDLARQLDCQIDDLPWQTSGQGEGMFQVAIVGLDGNGPVWVLVRIQGGSDVQIYTEHEWHCFRDGARGGEFDDLL